MEKERLWSQIATPSIKAAVRWILIIVFSVSGIGLIFSKPVFAVTLLLVAGVLLPYTESFLRRKYSFIFSTKLKAGAIIFLILIGGLSLPRTPLQNASVPVQIEEQIPLATVPQTAQQRFEDNLRNGISTIRGTSNIAYRGIETDSTMLTVSLNVSDFYNKGTFIKDTGEVSAKIFQTSFSSYLKPQDVLVWFYGEVTDRYGNKGSQVITVYAIDKGTYGKINWENFDSKAFCDFLKQEEKIKGIGSGPACNVTVNIE